jgi:hypothetical protein
MSNTPFNTLYDLISAVKGMILPSRSAPVD